VTSWNRLAREEAARQFGRRHYQWYAAWHLVRVLTPTLGVTGAAVVTLAGLWTLAQHHGWPHALRTAAAVLTAALAVWAGVHTLTGAHRTHRASGRRHPLAALAAATAVLLLALSFLLH
jgi:hypothetical protein